MKIPKDAIPDCYKYSKEAFEGNLKSKDAAEKIHAKHHLKLSSSMDYFNYFKFLKTDSGTCRSLSLYTQEYFLKRIFEDYGKEQLKKSLVAFMKLIVKFEAGKEGSKKSMRVIYEKYNQLI